MITRKKHKCRKSIVSHNILHILMHVSAHVQSHYKAKGTRKLRVTWSILQYLCSYWDLNLRDIEYVSCAKVIDYKMCMYNNSTLKYLKLQFKIMEC